jgi:hypothetical protein
MAECMVLVASGDLASYPQLDTAYRGFFFYLAPKPAWCLGPPQTQPPPGPTPSFEECVASSDAPYVRSDCCASHPDVQTC